MKKLVAVLLTVLMLFSLLQGVLRENVAKADETYQWVLINNGLCGADVTSLAIDSKNTDTIYAGTKYSSYSSFRRYGIFKSTNGGSSWNAVNNGLPGLLKDITVNSLAIDPTNTQIIYAGTNDGVFKSINGGAAWSQTGLTYDSVFSLAIDLKNTQIIYAGTDDGVFKSTDGGANWTEINNGLTNTNVNSLAIDPTNTQVIYAGTCGGVFKSINGGANWSQSGLTYDFVFSLAIDPKNTQIIYAGSNESNIFKSLDGGSNWIQIATGVSNVTTYSLAIDPTNTQIIYAATNYVGVRKSVDGGSSWSKINNGLTTTEVYSLAIDPTNTQVIYVGTEYSSIFKSTDGGSSWNAVNNGLIGRSVTSLAIDSKDTQVIYAGTDRGVFKSTNGGSSWNAINNGISAGVNSLVIDPKNTQTIYAGTHWDGVFKSTDGGSSWNAVNNGLPGILLEDTTVNSLAIDPKNTNIIYAGAEGILGGYGVFKSTDGGANWTEINNGLTNTNINFLAIDPKNTQIIYAGIDGNGVFKSIDGGAAWSQTGLTNRRINSFAIDPQNTDIIYAGTGNNGVFKSTNGGSSWNAINNGISDYAIISSLAIDPQNTDVIYAGTGDAGRWDYGIFKSTNGGSSWNAINNGMTDYAIISSLVIVPTNTQVVYAGVEEWYSDAFNGVFKLVTSSGLSCKIELQKNGVKIDKIDVGEPFDIIFTNYSGNIKQVRFLSDESQNGKVDEGFTWTDWYDWNVSRDDWTGHWDFVNKIKTWAFATTGEKEAWAEVKDETGQTANCAANIFSGLWSFAIITDLHIGYHPDPYEQYDYGTEGWNDNLTDDSEKDEYYLTQRVRAVVNRIINLKDFYNIRFVMVLGDITDTAERSEFLKAREILNALNDADIPYIPLIGNHDIWPYTQKPGVNPDDRKESVKEAAGYACGDAFFEKIFWDKSDEKIKKNIELVEDLPNWDKQPMPIPSELSHNIFLQNYAFTYGGIKFICLDYCMNARIPPFGDWKDSLAYSHPKTDEWIKNHSLKLGERGMYFSHYPDVSGFPKGSYFFAGHFHDNAGRVSEGDKRIRIEAVSREHGFGSDSGNNIRIVRINGDTIDDILEKPTVDYEPPAFITYTPGNPKPNEEITFKGPVGGISYQWDFGNGWGASSNDNEITYSYPNQGEYIVTLNVTYTDGVKIAEKRIDVRYKYILGDPPAGLAVTSVMSGEDVTTTSQNTNQQVLLTRITLEAKPIAEFIVRFENATEDIDLSNLTADVNFTERKSILYMPSWPLEIEESKTLYIPSTGKGAVYICKNAKSLEEVNIENADVVIKVGETKDGMTLSLTEYEDKEYYVVYGVTGAGGGEVNTYTITASSAGSGGTITPSGSVTVDYGANQTFTIIVDLGYHIADVKVDGSSVGAVTSYNFTNVDNNHEIDAYFEHNYIKTTYPTGTEVFSPTDTIHVTWDVEGFTGTEGKIRIFFYNGQSWSPVASNLDLADGYYDINLSSYTIVDPLRCRVRVGIYIPNSDDPSLGPWLTWGTNKQYYDESGHFWVIAP